MVNCAEELCKIAQVTDENYHYIPLLDNDTVEDCILFYQRIKPFLNFMDTVPLEDSPVLIHCYMGVSRSCSMVLAYLLHIGMFTKVEDAMQFIISKRSSAFRGDREILAIYKTALEEYFY